MMMLANFLCTFDSPNYRGSGNDLFMMKKLARVKDVLELYGVIGLIGCSCSYRPAAKCCRSEQIINLKLFGVHYVNRRLPGQIPENS
ncbi:hypothetical protein ACOSQ4_032925 [Xanthoceras sorbifolium]